MADKRDILIRLLGEETVSRMAERAGGGLDKFGDKLDATEKDAQDLDRQIAEVEGSLKTLATAFARTSDAADRVDITKAIRRQQTELRKLTKAKDLLPDFAKAGEEAATGFGASFVARIGPLLAKAPMGPAGAAIGAGIAIPASAILGATVSAAILGGVGGAGVIGGISLAAKDTRVKAAGKTLADNVTRDLEDSATRFVSPTIHGIGIIQSAWDDVADDVDGSLAAASRYVEPLARGLGGLGRELGPGLREAAEAAGPVIRELSDGLPRIGSALGGLLSTAADHADEAASAVRLIVMGIEAGINVTSSLVGGLGTLYAALVHAGTAAADFAYSYAGWIPIVGDKIADNRDRMHELRDALVEGGDAGGTAGAKIAGGLFKVPPAAAAATESVQTLSAAIEESTTRALASENAQIRLEQAIDDAARAAKEGADKGIDPNTEAGRKNRLALLGIAEAAKGASADILKNTGSHELAAVATERGRKKFLEAAGAMGVEAGKARELADKLFGIPTSRKTTITQPGMPSALANAKLLKQRIDSIDRRIDIHARMTTSYGGSAHSGQGYAPGMSTGGPVVGSGPKGVDSEVRRLAPGEHVLPAGEVDAAGGHAGVERIRAALRGGGSAPAPAGAATAGGGGSSVNLYATFTVNVPPTANLAEVGRQNAIALDAWARANGITWRAAS